MKATTDNGSLVELLAKTHRQSAKERNKEIVAEAVLERFVSEFAFLVADLGQPPDTLPKECDKLFFGIHRIITVSDKFERWTTSHGLDQKFLIKLLWLIANVEVSSPKNRSSSNSKRRMAVGDEISLFLSQKDDSPSQSRHRFKQLPGLFSDYALYVEVRSSVSSRDFSKTNFRYFYRDLLIQVMVDEIRVQAPGVPWEMLETIINAFGSDRQPGWLKKSQQRAANCRTS